MARTAAGNSAAAAHDILAALGEITKRLDTIEAQLRGVMQQVDAMRADLPSDLDNDAAALERKSIIDRLVDLHAAVTAKRSRRGSMADEINADRGIAAKGAP